MSKNKSLAIDSLRPDQVDEQPRPEPETPEQSKTQEPAAAQETPRPTKARALVDLTVDGKFYASGTLIQADANVIATLRDQVDTHPDAVVYCEKITNG